MWVGENAAGLIAAPFVAPKQCELPMGVPLGALPRGEPSIRPFPSAVSLTNAAPRHVPASLVPIPAPPSPHGQS